MKKGLEKYTEDFFFLLEGGFIAIKNTDEDSAIKLFRACELLKPESTFPLIGFGYMHLCKLELKQAATMFNRVLEKEPNNEMAKTFLGIVYSFNPPEMGKGEKILTEVATHSSDQGIKQLCGTAIDFLDQHVKWKQKHPSPAELQTPKKAKRTSKS
ncbi:MAG: hypothetical protein FJZ56_02510 [Chlamydiae bacterium]|nr:hypothetical protein [Chlamydiota bacterium]